MFVFVFITHVNLLFFLLFPYIMHYALRITVSVPGSTFPKAKPKQSLLTVLRLAVVRYLLLPLYAKWWVAQTSSRVFAFLLFLYLMQMINWAIYSYNLNKIPQPQPQSNNDSDTCIDPAFKTTANGGGGGDSGPGSNDFISITELIMPMCLSLMLSVIHSQIVATSSNNLSTADKHKKSPIHQHRKKRERRKRRKSVRIIDFMSTISGPQAYLTISFFLSFNSAAMHTIEINNEHIIGDKCASRY